jgi:hypothetical protein
MDVILGLSIGIGLTTLLVSALGRGALVLALVEQRRWRPLERPAAASCR